MTCDDKPSRGTNAEDCIGAARQSDAVISAGIFLVARGMVSFSYRGVSTKCQLNCSATFGGRVHVCKMSDSATKKNDFTRARGYVRTDAAGKWLASGGPNALSRQREDWRTGVDTDVLLAAALFCVLDLSANDAAEGLSGFL